MVDLPTRCGLDHSITETVIIALFSHYTALNFIYK